MSRILILLSLIAALFAAACCGPQNEAPTAPPQEPIRPLTTEDLLQHIAALQAQMDERWDEMTLAERDALTQQKLEEARHPIEHKPISEPLKIGARGQTATTLEVELGQLERNIRKEQFDTVRQFAKDKMPEIDRAPFLDAIADLEKLGLVIYASPPVTNPSSPTAAKFDLSISIDTWDPEEYRAMCYDLVLLNGKAHLSATREDKNWQYWSKNMTFENLPSRFTEPMGSWPLMSPATAIRAILKDHAERRARRKQRDAERLKDKK